MYQDTLMDIWERIRATLRQLRGTNQWRGTELHLIHKLEVRLQVEPRGNHLTTKEIVIHLSDAEVEVWAEARPGGQQYYFKDFEHDLDAFITHLVELARGKEYLHTNSEKADYRKNLQGEN